MELTKTNGFCEMNEMEMQEVDGGAIGPLGWMFLGFVVDGVLIASTGKSAGQWCADAIKETANLFKPETFY